MLLGLRGNGKTLYDIAINSFTMYPKTVISLSLLLVLAVPLVVSNPWQRFHRSQRSPNTFGEGILEVVTVIQLEEPCVRQGGICMRADECPSENRVTLQADLCPLQKKLGVECCYT